jgi:hypothetical protein
MKTNQLLNLLKNCASVDAAREELSDATPRTVVDAWKSYSGAARADYKTAREGLLKTVRERVFAAA